MQIQEIAEQAIGKDTLQNILQEVHVVLGTAEATVRQAIIENDIRLAEAYQEMYRQLEEYRFQVEYLIGFIESKHGPLGGRFPLAIESGEYLVTEDSDYLVVA